jgi:hypothetical protein
VSNLAHSALFGPSDKRLAILTGNKSRGFTRYDNDALGKPLRRLLGGLESLGMVEVAVVSILSASGLPQ